MTARQPSKPWPRKGSANIPRDFAPQFGAAERFRAETQALMAGSIRARLDLFEEVLEGLPPDRHGVLNRMLHNIAKRPELTYNEDDRQAVWVIGRALQQFLWDVTDAAARQQCEQVANVNKDNGE